MGSQGHPVIAIAYSPAGGGVVDEVIVTFVAEAEAEAMVERFRSKTDAREDEVIQSAIVKMIERSKAKTVEVS